MSLNLPLIIIASLLHYGLTKEQSEQTTAFLCTSFFSNF